MLYTFPKMKKFFEICDVSRWIPNIKFSYTKIFDIDMLSKLFNISKNIKYPKLFKLFSSSKLCIFQIIFQNHQFLE